MSTTLLAAASVVLLGAGGTVAVSEAWLPAIQIAAIVAAGSVLVSLAALGRAYLLFRLVRLVPIAAAPTPAVVERGGTPAAEERSGAPVAVERITPDTTPASAPPVPSGMNFAAPESSARLSGAELQREVFGKLAYRLQSLVHRLIHRVDQVEQEVEDPELLKSLYGIDHLATRIRRQIENLAVLGGEAPQRRSSVPVDVNAVLRAAIAEIEHYTQVAAVPIHEAKIQGHAVAEIIHLLAELLENATTFTTPGAPKVMLRAHRVAAGLAIQVQDRGIGMPMDDITRINRLLEGSTQVDVGQLLQDGRIGLAVVEILARRHNIGAELQLNIFGGTDASIVIPHELLSEGDAQDPSQGEAPGGQRRPAASPSTTSGSGVPSSTSGAAQGPGAAGSDTAAMPVQPRHAAQVQGRPTGAPPESAPPAASVPPSAAAQAVPVGHGERAPETGDDLRGRDHRRDDEERSHGSLPRRRRGESFGRLRSPAPDDASGADAVPGVGPDRAPHAPIGDVGAHESRRAEQPAPTPHDDQPRGEQSGRPPLPQRRGSHMREELREPTELMRPIPGHDPTLLAGLLEGRARGRDEPGRSEDPTPDAQQQPHTAHDRTR